MGRDYEYRSRVARVLFEDNPFHKTNLFMFSINEYLLMLIACTYTIQNYLVMQSIL